MRKFYLPISLECDLVAKYTYSSVAISFENPVADLLGSSREYTYNDFVFDVNASTVDEL